MVLTRNIAPAPSQFARGDDRRVDVVEAAFVEEQVNGHRHLMPQSGDGPKVFRARPEVRDPAKETRRLCFFF